MMMQTAGPIGSAVLLVCAILLVGGRPAQADVTLRSGVSGASALYPFAAYKLEQDWTIQPWAFALKLDGRIQQQDGVGDASSTAEWHAEHEFANATVMEFDLLHEYDREKDDSIEQSHTLGADIGLEHRFAAFTAKADFGVLGRIHADTTQTGFAALDRRDEDFLEREAALRLTANPASPWKPFVETAWLRRNYAVDTDRDFCGPDLILGVTAETSTLKGDAGLLLATRKAEGLAASTMIGPYVDLKWMPQPATELALDLSSGLDQDTTGDAKSFAFYEATFTATQAITEQLKVSAVLEATLEKRRTGHETEFTPTLKLDWTNETGLGTFASVGFTYSKTEGSPSEIAPSFEAGLKWVLN